MKSSSWRLCVLSAVAGLALVAVPVFAADEDRGGPRERLDRLEQRINELAERQEQLMHRTGSQPQAPIRSPGPDGMRQPMAQSPMPGPGQEGMRPPMPQAPMMSAGPDGMRQPMLQGAPGAFGPQRDVRGMGGVVGLLLLVGILSNILLSVWIYTDIRQRGEGPGIFIAVALLAGIPTAVIYALVRIGDRKSSPPS